MKTFKARSRHTGERLTLSSDDTFTLQMHGRMSHGCAGERYETTPHDLANVFSRRTLLALARRGDASDREKIDRALKLQ